MDKSFQSEVAKIAIPVALQSMLQSSFSMIDQIMVGQLGEKSIAAVEIAAKPSFIYAFVIGAVGTIAGIMISQYIGKKDIPAEEKSVCVNTLIMLIVGLLFMAISGLFARPFIALFTEDSLVITEGTHYLQLIGLTYIPLGISNICGVARPPEHEKIKNVALMMFCDHADKFFPYMQVEIVRFPNGSIKDPKNFIEVPPIKGTVPQIISRTMEKLQDMVIEEYVQKVPDRMEANRFMSYPYEVLEEAVVNAFYHRDYMCYEPVQIEIEPDCIKITSFPGIDRSISLDTIEKSGAIANANRRSRIDFCEAKRTYL